MVFLPVATPVLFRHVSFMFGSLVVGQKRRLPVGRGDTPGGCFVIDRLWLACLHVVTGSPCVCMEGGLRSFCSVIGVSHAAIDCLSYSSGLVP